MELAPIFEKIISKVIGIRSNIFEKRNWDFDANWKLEFHFFATFVEL